MNDGLDLGTLRRFVDALLIGALVGIEREKRKSAEPEVGIGGLRTFILLALLGAIAGWLADALHMPALFVAVIVVVGAAVLTATCWLPVRNRSRSGSPPRARRSRSVYWAPW